jgi:hypothetical protein
MLQNRNTCVKISNEPFTRRKGEDKVWFLLFLRLHRSFSLI